MDDGENRWIRVFFSFSDAVCEKTEEQVVDIKSLSFRDHLPLTLIYFGTANKVRRGH